MVHFNVYLLLLLLLLLLLAALCCATAASGPEFANCAIRCSEETREGSGEWIHVISCSSDSGKKDDVAAATTVAELLRMKLQACDRRDRRHLSGSDEAADDGGERALEGEVVKEEITIEVSSEC